jgi:hypothetical protein
VRELVGSVEVLRGWSTEESRSSVREGARLVRDWRCVGMEVGGRRRRRSLWGACVVSGEVSDGGKLMVGVMVCDEVEETYRAASNCASPMAAV